METVPPTYLSTSPESSVLLNVEVYLREVLEPMFIGLQSKAYQSNESASSSIFPSSMKQQLSFKSTGAIYMLMASLSISGKTNDKHDCLIGLNHKT